APRGSVERCQERPSCPATVAGAGAIGTARVRPALSPRVSDDREIPRIRRRTCAPDATPRSAGNRRVALRSAVRPAHTLSPVTRVARQGDGAARSADATRAAYSQRCAHWLAGSVAP